MVSASRQAHSLKRRVHRHVEWTFCLLCACADTRDTNTVELDILTEDVESLKTRARWSGGDRGIGRAESRGMRER